MKKPSQPVLMYFVLGIALIAMMLSWKLNAYTSLLICAIPFIGAIIFINKRNALIKEFGHQREDAVDVYKAKYLNALKQGTGQVEIETDDIKKSLGLSDEESKVIDEKARKKCLDELVRGYVEGEMLSPENDQNITITAQRLNVNLTFDSETRKYLEKLRQYWAIENKDLPVVAVALSIDAGEVCNYHGQGGWNEYRTVTTSISYTGLTSSAKIFKGLRFRSVYSGFVTVVCLKRYLKELFFFSINREKRGATAAILLPRMTSSAGRSRGRTSHR